ncbi:hypothetical protein SeF2_047 [Salmonella phage SeF2]|uniref:Uncharacterized protein n=1 Tax=Salmonella phage PMBT21 TaxID=3153512 RepID=A0AAU8GIW4_9CAUD|nr:hypothetical protein SeF2_047 [Salmonella phage SeF2]WDS51600.1 hypothetical protein SeF6b_047 [Salmonella phage SeF6b]
MPPSKSPQSLYAGFLLPRIKLLTYVACTTNIPVP